MKLLILSDLHFEFHADCGKSFLENTSWPDHDVAVIAGDLANSKKIEESLMRVCDTFNKVVYTFGNHEFYHSSVRKVQDKVHDLAVDLVDQLFVLDNSTHAINDQRFIGGTMWTPKSTDRPAKVLMNDFKCIQHFEQVYEDHDDFMDLVLPKIEPTDIVITHHLPSYKSVPTQFKGSSLNQFFVNDLEEVIYEKQPKLWIHGHTHSCFDYYIGATRVVCNPHGYPGENPNFRTDFVVEV